MISNYRISIARSGYYYVQRYGYNGWKQVGGFFKTRAGARTFARDLKHSHPFSRYAPSVVEYV